MFKDYYTQVLSILLAIVAILASIVKLRWSKQLERLYENQLRAKEGVIELKDVTIQQLTTTIQGLEKLSPVKFQQEYENCIKELEGEIASLKAQKKKQGDKLSTLKAQAKQDKRAIELSNSEVELSNKQILLLEKELSGLKKENETLIEAIKLLRGEPRFATINSILIQFRSDRGDHWKRCEAYVAAQAKAAAATEGAVFAEAAEINRRAEAAVESERRLREAEEEKKLRRDLP